MKTVKYLALCLVLTGVVACTKTVTVKPSSYPASEVMTDRKITTPTGYTFADNFKSQGLKFECGAYSYNTVVGGPLAQTIRNAMEISFNNLSEVPAGMRKPYNIRVDMEDISGHMGVQPGFWSATVFATVSLSAHVNVTDDTGRDIAKAVVSGTGEASASGNCVGADSVVEIATEKAIKKIGSDFVFKIINSSSLH